MPTRRERSIAEAAAVGCSIPTWLPLAEPPEVRSEEAVVGRALAVLAVTSAAYGYPTADARGWLRQHGFDSWLTADEQDFLDSDGGDEAASFRDRDLPEALWVLVWALGRAEAIDFEAGCPDDLVHRLPNLRALESPDDFIASAQLRDVEEIADLEDLAYVLDWCRVDRLLRTGDTFRLPGIGARRRALGWLVTQSRWDEVGLDT